MGWWRSPWKLRRFARLIKTYGRFGCFPSNFNETPRKESGSSVGESPSLIFRHTRKRTRFKYSQRGHFHFRPLPVSRNIIVGNCPRAKRLRISRSMTEFRSYRRLVPCVYFQWARGKHSKRCQTLDSTELNFKRVNSTLLTLMVHLTRYFYFCVPEIWLAFYIEREILLIFMILRIS